MTFGLFFFLNKSYLLNDLPKPVSCNEGYDLTKDTQGETAQKKKRKVLLVQPTFLSGLIF